TTCFSFTKFLTFNHTRIATKQPLLFQRWTEFGIHFAKCTGNTQFDSLGLAFRTTTLYVYRYIILINSFNSFERKFYLILQINQREIVFVFFVVNLNLAGTLAQVYTGYCFFTT